MDKFTAMRTFRRVIELGSFSAAARDLRLSSAGVSKHIAELEAHLGISLIARTTRRLSPTEAGETFFEHSRRILDAVEEAETAVGDTTSGPRGTLRVHAPMSFGLLHLVPGLLDFAKLHPDVRIDLSMNDSEIDLKVERFDVTLRIRTMLPDSSLAARRLGSIGRVACAAPAYLDQAGVPTTPLDLRQHRCLIYSLSATPGEWTFRPLAGGEPITVEVGGGFTADNSMVLRQALLEGHGIGLMPTFVVGEDLRLGRLVHVLHDFAVPAHRLFAVYHRSRYIASKVRTFVDFLADRFGRDPPWDRSSSPQTER